MIILNRREFNRREFNKLLVLTGAQLFSNTLRADLSEFPLSNSSRRARIAFGGDTLLGGYYNSPRYGTRLDLLAKIDLLLDKGGVSAVVNHFFEEITPFFNLCNLVIANLEGPITQRLSTDEIKKRVYHKMFPLRQHEQTADILKAAGITVVSLANNHTYDFEEGRGLEYTLEQLEGKVGVVGAGIREEAFSAQYYNLNGLNIAILALTDVVDPLSMIASASSSRTGERFGVSGLGPTRETGRMLHKEYFASAVKEAKRKADFTLVYLHAGPRRGSVITPRQRRVVDWLRSLGVDIIVGAHSHKKQAVQEFSRSENPPQIICYGIGNLVFGAYHGTQDISCIPIFDLMMTSRGERAISYTLLDIIPSTRGDYRPHFFPHKKLDI